jgi:hypothetical protein
MINGVGYMIQPASSRLNLLMIFYQILLLIGAAFLLNISQHSKLFGSVQPLRSVRILLDDSS